MVVTPEKNWTAEFKLGIIQTAKREAEKLLKEKYQRQWNEKGEKENKKLTSKQRCEIDKQAKEGAKKVI